MELGGYAGNILYINLTDGSIRKQPLDEDLVKDTSAARVLTISLPLT